MIKKIRNDEIFKKPEIQKIAKSYKKDGANVIIKKFIYFH